MDAGIVNRGSRIPKICALGAFVLAVFFYAGLCSGDFFDGADFVRADPLEGAADLPEAVRAISFALMPSLLSFASVFALSFTPYCAVSCAICTALRAFASGAALAAGISDAAVLYASFVFQAVILAAFAVVTAVRHPLLVSVYALGKSAPRQIIVSYTEVFLCMSGLCAFVHTAAVLISHFLR